MHVTTVHEAGCSAASNIDDVLSMKAMLEPRMVRQVSTLVLPLRRNLGTANHYGFVTRRSHAKLWMPFRVH